MVGLFSGESVSVCSTMREVWVWGVAARDGDATAREDGPTRTLLPPPPPSPLLRPLLLPLPEVARRSSVARTRQKREKTWRMRKRWDRDFWVLRGRGLSARTGARAREPLARLVEGGRRRRRAFFVRTVLRRRTSRRDA
ncbi:unnamed protein product [Scytosiphon promiscuus]